VKKKKPLAFQFCIIKSLKPKATIQWFTIPLCWQLYCCKKNGNDKTPIMLPLRKKYGNLQWHPIRYQGIHFIAFALEGFQSDRSFCEHWTKIGLLDLGPM